VPAEQRSKLFQPYERLDADRIGVPGTGLGLAIAARLVALLGGRIGHDDNPAGGSVFWIELPLRATTAPPPPAAPIAPAPPTRSLRILLADDSAMNRDVAAAFLHAAGHTVVEATDGEAALRLVAAEAFDVVLMDLRMPLLDGIEATQHIRALPGQHGQTPIVAVTAEVQEDGGAALRAAGFQACLLKPIDQMSLLAAVALATAGRPSATGEHPSAVCGHPSAMTAAPATFGLLTPTPPISFPDAPASAMPALPLPASPVPTSRVPIAPCPVSAPQPPDITARLPEGIASATVEGHLEMFATQLVSLLEQLDNTTEAASPGGGAAGSPDPSERWMPGSRSDAAADCSDRSSLVRSAAPHPRPAQVDLAHRIAGDGGQLGFMALSAAARRYEAAWHQDLTHLPQAAAALRDMAENALQALGQRRDFMRRAAMSSAKLP
jgi:CheY-like chemotaxis protein/HPt (histidine-containing phosphotransfer) domain-containing protein